MDNTEISVTLKVEQLQTQRVTVPASQVSLTGENSAYDYSVNSGLVTVQVQGLAEDLARLTQKELTLSADVSGADAGVHAVSVDVSLSADFADRMEVLSASPLSVTVRSRNAQAPQTTAAETAASTDAAEGDTGSDTTAEGGTTGT